MRKDNVKVGINPTKIWNKTFQIKIDKFKKLQEKSGKKGKNQFFPTVRSRLNSKLN